MSNDYIYSFIRDKNRSFGFYDNGEIDETFPVQYRGAICQIADWAGYVPVLGIAVGVARIALSVFALIGCAVSSVSIRFVFVCSDTNIECCQEMLEKVDIIAQRAVHEFFRGIGEIIQPINWIMEGVTMGEDGANSGTLNSMRPTGSVYYVNQEGVVCYPWREHNAFNKKYDERLALITNIDPDTHLPVVPQPVPSAPLYQGADG